MPTFKDLEQPGWTEKAPAYDDHFAPITRQAIAPILDALGELAGGDLLDIARSTGDPPSPPPYRFADRQQAAEALAAAGFSATRFDQRIAWWHGTDAQQLLDLVYQSTVRAPMLIEAQSPGERRAIREDLRARVEAKRLEGRISLRWPFLLVTAIKQAG
jgi:hypothetical protein